MEFYGNMSGNKVNPCPNVLKKCVMWKGVTQSTSVIAYLLHNKWFLGSGYTDQYTKET